MSKLKDLMSRDYRISLQKDEEEGVYFASLDELPGCLADGATPSEAVENLAEAKKAWISSRLAAGLDIPTPKDIGDFSGRILVRMPKSLHRRLSSEAATEGVSLNQYIVSTLSEAYGRVADEFQDNILNTIQLGISGYLNNIATETTTWQHLRSFALSQGTVLNNYRRPNAGAGLQGVGEEGSVMEQSNLQIVTRRTPTAA